jgi:Flp pilus assembly protein TadD
VVGEASRVLGDDQSRADYLESLKSGGGTSVDVRQVLAAEDTFHKGVAFIKARRFVEAVKTLDDAITLNPREGEFYAWRGYARYFTSLDKKASLVDAMRDLHHALKLNERCAPAHYLIGQLHKLSGDNALALKHFKKCVSLDAAHVDAQREIRLLVGR